MRRAEVVRGLEPLAAMDVNHARNIHQQYEEVCGCPAIWERAFDDLLGCFKTPEAAIRAFRVLDSDGNGLVDSREMFGALALLSRGHLTERMTLVFDVFDLQREKEINFDECFLMIRRTLAGLRKMVGIHAPPEKVVHNMTRQVWRAAQKHRDVRITQADWYAWWSSDASCRNGLKIFIWKPEELRGLPTPDNYISVDYTRGISDNEPEAPTQIKRHGSFSQKAQSGSRPSSATGVRPSLPPSLATPFVEPALSKPRRPSFTATVDKDGNVSRPVFEDVPPVAPTMSKRGTLVVPNFPG